MPEKRQLIIDPAPGRWRRSSGETIDIASMNAAHLKASAFLVDSRKNEATATLEKVRALQAKYSTGETPQGKQAVAELTSLIDNLEKKHGELSSELMRKIAATAP